MLAPLPEPPTDLASLSLLVRPYKHDWWRIHALAYHPLYFGRSKANRFDAPGAEFGVMYAGGDEHAAFIETLGRATGVRILAESDLKLRGLARVAPHDPAGDPLRLVDLTGEGLKRLGLDARLATDDNQSYALSQRWALAIHGHPKSVDGIVYLSRNDPSRRCVALFERAEPKLVVEPRGGLLDVTHTKLLGEILDTYEFAVV